MLSNNCRDELEPRPVPKPTQFQEISARPEVPELSVIFDSSDNISKLSDRNPSYATSQATQETYSEWKNRQNRSPLLKDSLYHESRDKHYASSAYNDCDQNPYSRFSDKMSYKSGSECFKCAGQSTPTVKDIYNMMQMQNDQMKFLLETIQKLLVTVLSNQQNQHKCCCIENHYCKQNDNLKASELFKNMETQTTECQLSNSIENLTDKPNNILKKDESLLKNNESNTNSKCLNKADVMSKIPAAKNKLPNPLAFKGDNSNNEKNTSKEKEKTYSVVSDESLDLNENDVQVNEASISPEQSIHIEMKSSSEDSSNSECEEENSKPIKVGWTMYNNILGQVNNLLEGPDVAKPIEHEKAVPMTKPKNFEPHKYFMLPENNKIDSSLQMQALAMQYLSPEQAVKFDINKHFVPTQPTKKSPNNYSISTLHYMERYHLIGSEKNYNTENLQHQISSEGLLSKKKKISRKNKTPSKILNITELKQQPKLP